MNYRRLGQSGLKVSEISLGNWLTQGKTLDQEQTNHLVQRAFDLGINLFDTADVYTQGEGEKALGVALKTGIPRRQVVIATKCYFPFSSAVTDRGLSRKHIFESIHDSLLRLQMDYVDILQCHRYDHDTPLEETVAAMGDLVRQGKILYWGVSEWSASQISQAVHIARSLAVSAPIVNQPQYNIFNNWIEREVVPTSNTLGLGQIVFSPLAQGILTGKYLPGQPFPHGSRASDSNSNQFMLGQITDEKLAQVQQLGELAKDAGMTMSQLALRWCLRTDGISSCIVGASRTEQIDENASASKFQLTPELANRIEEIVGRGQ